MIDCIKTRKRLADKLAEIALVTLAIEVDDTPVRGNAIDSGDNAEDRLVEDEIIARLDRGDEWAWCVVKVSVVWEGFEAHDYLGCCSYDNERAFREDGYFTDMVRNCCTDLVSQLFAAREALTRLDERTKG